MGTDMMTYPKYGSHLLKVAYNTYGGKLVTRVLTLVSVRTPAHAMKPGDLKDTGAGSWLLACPKCGFVAYLDHTIEMTHDQISISPSVECINPGCEFHEVISAWELRKAWKKKSE